jgi:uncharacterized coiled-coil DUF342 family protein
MLVSLSSYCQYPVVKTIGKDTVVIMTVKQGEDINKQFTLLKDSLSSVNEESLRLRSMVNKLSVEIDITGNSLIKSTKELELYKSSYKHAEADIVMLKKENRRVVTGLLILLAVWTGYTASLF